MGYNLHIVRTENWFDSESDPVTKSDVDRVIASDESLAWSTTDYVDMSDESGAVTRYYMICWNGAPAFWWCRSEITCKNPNESQIVKLHEIARALDAKLVGDEGELYELQKSVLGIPKVVSRQQ